MKNINQFSRLSLIAIALFLLSSCNNTGKQATSSTTTTSAVSAGSRIAYVNIDTLEANYDYLKSKKQEFKSKQERMESELERSAKQMEDDAAQVQSKAQAGTLSEAEYKAAQKRIGQMQQSLVTRKQALTDELMKDQEEFNKTLKSQLDSFLEQYNKEKHYDYILSYGTSGSILFANKQLDITNDVIKGMNTMHAEATKKK
ncbi:MAG: OmpH family outer membrane protein [Taibaiella sp.]|nr:OmpH family outer membrane protein [Taibaiella sp.]